jgi:hypothetical protein
MRGTESNDSSDASGPASTIISSVDVMAITSNVLYLHSSSGDRVGRTRSGSLVPENSPLPVLRPEHELTPRKQGAPFSSSGSGTNDEMVYSMMGKREMTASTSSPHVDVVQISEWENLAFLLISFGYMVPWTSLGSLISYFKHTYNANFYNKLYCAYYLPGLPVAVLQHLYDGAVDMRIGSRTAYMLRGVISFLIMIAILISMVWWREQNTLILLFVTLGVFSWLCHGTASMLASMYPATAIAYLQTGFRCPEIYTIAIVAALNIGSHPSERDLDIFFSVTAGIVLLSLAIWIVVVGSSASRRLLDLKDVRMKAHLSSETTDAWDRDKDKDRDRDREKGGGEDYDEFDEHDPLMPPLGSVRPRKGSLHQNQTQHQLQQQQQRLRAKLVLKAVEDASMRDAVYRKVFSLCLALFITIWCSIFQASFFAFCDSPQGRDIEQILYFVRLFSDLLGRPLTRLPRPWFLQENHHVLSASVARISLMLVFFCYVFIASFPKWVALSSFLLLFCLFVRFLTLTPLNHRSDFFISLNVGFFSALSGYLTVLIYEYAVDGLDGAAQTYATGLLNMSFQLAAFSAVLLSVLITSTEWIQTVTGNVQ